MAAPSPIVPLLGAAIIGGLGYVAYTVLSKGGGKFQVVGGSRFWDKSQAGALKAKLATLKATPGPVERTWVLGPTGTESALARVQAIQADSSFAVTTDNLLGGGGPMGLSQVLATEVATLAPASGNTAALPAIT